MRFILSMVDELYIYCSTRHNFEYTYYRECVITKVLEKDRRRKLCLLTVSQCQTQDKAKYELSSFVSKVKY